MSKFEYPSEPTADQCTNEERVADVNGQPAFACWYPQMGGYVAKCVIMKENSDPDSCFGAFIWHDGSFPFTADTENENSPYYLHHCSPSQFIEFGETVLKKSEEYFK